MIRLNRRQRAALSETFREFANLTAAALVVGQFVTDRPLSWLVIGMGLVIWAGFIALGLLLEGERPW